MSSALWPGGERRGAGEMGAPPWGSRDPDGRGGALESGPEWASRAGDPHPTPRHCRTPGPGERWGRGGGAWRTAGRAGQGHGDPWAPRDSPVEVGGGHSETREGTHRPPGGNPGCPHLPPTYRQPGPVPVAFSGGSVSVEGVRHTAPAPEKSKRPLTVSGGVAVPVRGMRVTACRKASESFGISSTVTINVT